MKRILIVLCTLTFCTLSVADDLPSDPLGSVQWNDMYNAFLKGHPAVFDKRVKVLAAGYAEDPMNVPVTVDASELENVEQLVIFADFNPIPLIAKYYPTDAKPSLSFRFKIQQASPVRAAALVDGVWHVGSLWINTAGGGCTVASVGRMVGDWSDYLGDTYGKRWSGKKTSRVRLLIHHPMDTGLVEGIPEFYIQDLEFFDEADHELARIELFEPINENPTLGFEFNNTEASSVIFMMGADNNGNEFEARFAQ
ncbi:MAG: hypothetical protein A6F72_00835 [Cycloclasticus sp. symbiont of Poecilosclerida sp. N]|nr:MAG: hypothetical protein A6F72_00835 [Cycloclasticus sp. symbiont of Poecilosclerida sp. N]